MMSCGASSTILATDHAKEKPRHRRQFLWRGFESKSNRDQLVALLAALISFFAITFHTKDRFVRTTWQTLFRGSPIAGHLPFENFFAIGSHRSRSTHGRTTSATRRTGLVVTLVLIVTLVAVAVAARSTLPRVTA